MDNKTNISALSKLDRKRLLDKLQSKKIITLNFDRVLASNILGVDMNLLRTNGGTMANLEFLTYCQAMKNREDKIR